MAQRAASAVVAGRNEVQSKKTGSDWADAEERHGARYAFRISWGTGGLISCQTCKRILMGWA